jgi:Aromatic-ring hydroxylase, C-terminal
MPRADAPILVVGDVPAPADPPREATLVHDPDRALHPRYGAQTACLYLIRPDGYVGYRSTQPTASGLREYLDRVFSPASAH